MKTIQASVVQMPSLDGQVDANLDHASKLALEAKKRGAELVLFPEFMSQGYRLTTEIWHSAEPLNGLTTAWLCATAKELNIYIGSSFLEASKGHFLNTFTMANPSGKIIGIVRKRYPSLWEAYFFKGSPGEHTFETDFGRVGVGICFDNHTDLPIRKPIPKHSRYIYPGPIGREIIRLMEWQGKLSYTLNKERKKMALSAEQVA